MSLYKLQSLSKKNIYNTILITFSIPMANFIYYIVSTYFHYKNGIENALIIGYISLFAIVPAVFCVSCILCFISKKYYRLNRNILIGSILVEVFGFILMNFALNTGLLIEKYQNIAELNKYDVIIEYVENYKNKKGEYPQSIPQFDVKTKVLDNYKYETIDNKKGYVLSTGNNSFHYQYRFCSDEIAEYECVPGIYTQYERKYFYKKWLKDYPIF